MNRQVHKTKNLIFEALFKKMQIKPYHDITIVEITEKADVARLSFYRHFKTKEDIVIYKFREIVGKMICQLNTSTFNSFKEILGMVLGAIENYMTIFNVIIKNNLYGLILQSFGSDFDLITKKLIGIDGSNVYLLKFYEGALVNLIVEWIRSEKIISKEEYLDILDNLFHKQKLLINNN